jgi:hypothetical protein
MGMMGMSRDALWTKGYWQMIDQAVSEEMNRVRIAQKIFPVVPMIGETSIPDDSINVGAAVLNMPERDPMRFVELFVQFTVTPMQADSESRNQTAFKLVRLAAKHLAQAEDRILFLGQAALPGLAALGAAVQSTTAVQTGLIFENPKPPVVVDPTAGAGIYPESIFGGVTTGNSQLHGDGQNEPLGLALHTDIFADAHAPTAASLVMPADRINGIVREDSQGKGGFHPSEALIVSRALVCQQIQARINELTAEGVPVPPELAKYLKAEQAKSQNELIPCGLLAAQAGMPTKIYVSKHAVTEYTQTGATGQTLNFRVTEKIQYSSHDARSLLRMEFRKP